MKKDMKYIITSMLKENTGTHFLDSGGANGRSWQKNQLNDKGQRKTCKDFESESCISYEIWNNEITYTINVFHYLNNAELCTDYLCDKFNKIQQTCDNWEGTGELTECYGVSKEAWIFLENNTDVKVCNTWNTYNGESNLSQVLQGSYLDINGESYLLLQIHNGADVRGGYTNAKLFKMENFQEWLPCENVCGTIDGIQVDNMYNGYSLTDENGNEIPVNENSKVELYLLEA